MGAQRPAGAARREGRDESCKLLSRVQEVAKTLQELLELLEDYGPVWYTEEHHKRALEARRILEKLGEYAGERSAMHNTASGKNSSKLKIQSSQ